MSSFLEAALAKVYDDGFPAWFYHPVTGEGRCYDFAADVPDGHVTCPPAEGSGEFAPASEATPGTLTKAELVEALTAATIPFKQNASVASLTALLDEKLTAYLVSTNKTFEATASLRDKLNLAKS